ncbi:MAG: hypothetical protein RL129_990 [Actinomycetota bacterium]
MYVAFGEAGFMPPGIFTTHVCDCEHESPLLDAVPGFVVTSAAAILKTSADTEGVAPTVNAEVVHFEESATPSTLHVPFVKPAESVFVPSSVKPIPLSDVGVAPYFAVKAFEVTDIAFALCIREPCAVCMC